MVDLWPLTFTRPVIKCGVLWYTMRNLWSLYCKPTLLASDPNTLWALFAVWTKCLAKPLVARWWEALCLCLIFKWLIKHSNSLLWNCGLSLTSFSGIHYLANMGLNRSVVLWDVVDFAMQTSDHLENESTATSNILPPSIGMHTLREYAGKQPGMRARCSRVIAHCSYTWHFFF